MARVRFVTPEKVRLHLADGETWIEVKKRLTVGESRQAVTSFVGKYNADGSRTPNLDTLGMGQTLAYLLAWNLRDAEDRPVAVSLDAIKQLDPRDYAEIEAAIDKHIADVEADAIAQEKKAPASIALASSRTS